MKTVLFVSSRLLFLTLIVFAINVSAQTEVKDLWSVTATSAADYNAAYLGNGVVGFRSEPTGLSAEKVVLNGLYDHSPLGDNVRLINYFNPLKTEVTFKEGGPLVFGTDVANWMQTLNVKEAVLYTSYDYASKLRVATRMLALRNLPMATLGIYEFEALADIEFTVQNTMKIPDREKTPGIQISKLNYEMYALNTTEKHKIPVMHAVFPTESAKESVAGAVTYYFDGPEPVLTYEKTSAVSQQLTFTVTLKKGEKFSFCALNAFTHSGFTNDVYNDAVRICSREYKLGYRHLLAGHIAAWQKLWQSDLEIEGDDEAQIDARLALYSLYSSITTGFGLSLPPCGLSTTGWGGHIFWDADLWMFSPLLVTQPALAASMVDFRFNTLPQAKKRAAQFGCAGAMFPWESDLLGNECTPISYKLDMNEHHVSSDVALAAWDYYLVTKDRDWLQQKGYPLIQDIANFWVSRSTKAADGSYHINNVVGPDEYLEDIDDDAFTNGAVKVVMDAANQSARLLNKQPDPLWKEVQDHIVILKHPDGQTWQSAQYKGQRIKQADVNLLAFPLELITDKAQIVKDLDYYEAKIDPRGPSMSYCVLATSHARLGQNEKAWELFQKAYQPNRKPPFGFISEKIRKSDTVFCTGYGGMLQTIIFGFAGLKIDETGLSQGTPHLPAHWKKLTIKISGQKDIVCLPNSVTH